MTIEQKIVMAFIAMIEIALFITLTVRVSEGDRQIFEQQWVILVHFVLGIIFIVGKIKLNF